MPSFQACRNKIIKIFDIATLNLKMNDLTGKTIFDKKERYRILLLITLALGTGLRLFHYFYNRSLWMDEIYLSSSFSHLNYADLATRALDYQQKAPIGFLWLVKLSLNLFGYNEMALRLIPLLAGIASIFYFERICRYFLKPRAKLLALCIFAFAPALIYHAVEIKQYSTECLATIIALYLFIQYKDRNSWAAKISWGILGGLILWFSFSVIFILAGIATGLSLHYLLKKDWKSFFSSAFPFCIWLVSFILNYILFTHKHAESTWVVYFFKVYDNFMPFPPHSLQELKWFPRNFYSMMDYPLGLIWNIRDLSSGPLLKIITIPLIPVILLFSGIICLYRKNRDNFFALLFPVIFMLIASGLYLYPLLERFWVFIAPVFILFTAIGYEYYQKKIKSTTFSWILFLVIAGSPIVQSVYFIIQPQYFYRHKKSFEKEALAAINNQYREGDAVYNYWNNAPGYKVYKHIFNFNYTAIEGQDFRKTSKDLAAYNRNLRGDFDHFSGKKRVWLLYNTQFLTDIGDFTDDPVWYYKSQQSPAENLLTQFQHLGKPVKKLIYKDITIYLFELIPQGKF
jgi:4-amino-4-deoxy-L-arabinose transferase-like glycosyltransferase